MPYRHAGDALHILLVTSRGSGRWVLPKGNIDPGLTASAAVAKEAEEEAGVRGRLSPAPIGRYRYDKLLDDGTSRPIDVDVFALAVTEELATWKEDGQRERQWFAQPDAAAAIDEPDLKLLIRAFRLPGQ